MNEQLAELSRELDREIFQSEDMNEASNWATEYLQKAFELGRQSLVDELIKGKTLGGRK
jgi:hypothetical protein